MTKVLWLIAAVTAGGVIGFASYPRIDCETLTSAVLVDSDDDNKVELNELLTSATILRAAGCDDDIASDEVIEARLRACDTEVDDNEIDAVERRDCIAALPAGPVDELVQCVERAKGQCGPEGSRFHVRSRRAAQHGEDEFKLLAKVARMLSKGCARARARGCFFRTERGEA